MSKFLSRLEKKFGRYAINNLSLYIVAGYAIGYVLQSFVPAITNLISLNPYQILHGQIWRLVTWMLIPPSGYNIIFLVIMLYFYYSIGTVLERTWGAFRYNVYIISGMLFTAIGAFILYFVRVGFNPISTYYINMSIFLAFAANYPDMQVLFMFIIPVKIKWMAYVYGLVLLYDCIKGNAEIRVAVIASLLNFILFFLSTKNMKRITPKEIHRKRVYHQQVNSARGVTKHKCAICGRTEEDDPNLEFRFCSKCNGNYEYCQEHLFTHKHVK